MWLPRKKSFICGWPSSLPSFAHLVGVGKCSLLKKFVFSLSGIMRSHLRKTKNFGLYKIPEMWLVQSKFDSFAVHGIDDFSSSTLFNKRSYGLTYMGPQIAY